MKKLVILFVIQITVFSYNMAFSQDTTIQDALEFIETNLNHSSKATNTEVSDSFQEIFYTDESYTLNYDYNGQYTYSVISTDYCKITFLEKLSSKTRISFAEEDESHDVTPIYSNFGYLNLDTITIDFSKISRIESDRSTIKISTYNNINSIEHRGQTTRTPPLRREDDLVNDLRENEDVLYRKLKKFMKDNKLNYEVYPNKIDKYSYTTNKFIIYNIDKEKSKRLVRAFTFLQQNCGVPKEKF